MTTVFVNNTDLLSSEWRFLEPVWSDPRATWEFFHGTPKNWLERSVSRPHLGRYRAALQAVRSARARPADSILVSHLPAMTAATNLARRHLCPDVRHIAFAFNFTDLPTGYRLSYFRRALQGIEQFVVFSEAERALYSQTFNIPKDRLRMLHWAMDAPVPGSENPAPFDGPYLCAVGGEGRDYTVLAEALRYLPEIKLALVARPHSIAGIDFPENVYVFVNLPAPQTWRLAQESGGMIIPLKTGQTNCGHVTIVGAQLLNIPLIVTRSAGVIDYVDDQTAFMTEPGNVADMIKAIRTLSYGQEPVKLRQCNALKTARARSSQTHWVRYFESLLDTHPAPSGRD
ncbi:hypothetical protein AB838_01110 [Rhodobacteraceae bacterium (ex Bugula neritina AB1)]|nr:hypothetical protein AB838_01110 [Rhodobacteraceae bacterium (ex Bugula neritina AB1)]